MTDPNRAKRVGKNAPWPKGKPRREPDPRWNKLRKKANEALETVDRNYAAGTNYRSGAYIAELCGVNRGTVSRWLAGTSYPPKEAIDVIEKWLIELEV
jgi:transcriptional regulator with XRE-family HTH domain